MSQIQDGCLVIIHGLRDVKFNGVKGLATKQDPQSGRWIIQLQDRKIKVKEENLRICEDGSFLVPLTTMERNPNDPLWFMKELNKKIVPGLLVCRSKEQVWNRLDEIKDSLSIQGHVDSSMMSSQLGSVASKQNRTDIAIWIYLWGMEQLETSLHKKVAQVNLHDLLATAYRRKSDVGNQIFHAEKALRLLNECGSLWAESKHTIVSLPAMKAKTMSSLASAYQSKGELQKANELYLQSLDELENVTYERSHFTCYRDYGNFLMVTGRSKDAIYLWKKLCPWAEKQDLSQPDFYQELFLIHQALGKCYVNTGDTHRAIQSLEKYANMMEQSELSYIDHIIGVRVTLATLYGSQKNFKKSLKILNNLKKITESDGIRDGIEACRKRNASAFRDVLRNKVAEEKSRYRATQAAGIGDHDGKMIGRRFGKQKECATCHAKRVQLYECSRCKAVYYCSQKCQKEDYKQHKKICRKR